MAIKGNDKAKQGEENASISAATGAETAANPPKRGKGAPRGSRTKPNRVWRDEHNRVLVPILKEDKGAGAIRTASSVAQALNQHELFKANPVNPQQVANYLKQVEKRLQNDGKPVPAYLHLDKGSRARVDVSAFEE